MNFLLVLLSAGIFRKNGEIISSKKWAVTKNEGFTDKSVRQGGTDGLGSGRRRYVRLSRGGGCRRGIHDCRGAALAAGGIYMLLSSTVGILTIAAVLTGSILMLISGCIFCSGARQAWSAAEYILAADPDVSIKQALRQSRDIMRGHCRAFARFKAGFALWFLSCVLILPAFFVVPYYGQSCAVWMTETLDFKNKVLRK